MRFLVLLFALPAFALNNGVRIYDASAATQTSQPRTIHRYFAQGEFPAGTYAKPRVDGSVPASWQVDIENTWPDGSIMAAFVSLPVSIAANGSVLVDFVADSNPCHLGGLSTCQAAALSQSAMLAFNGSAWDATISGTANSITYSANVRTMVTAGAWIYRLRGPVVTQIVVEDVSRPSPTYDFGWQYTGGAWGAPPSDTYKSVHPIFTVSFYAGWSGAEIEVIAQNPWITRGQRQVFDLGVTKSGAASVYSKASFDLPWGSQFSRYFWDGSSPAAVQVDFNLRYMISTRLIPPMDYSLTAPTTTVNALTSQYDTRLGLEDPQSCTDGGFCGNVTKYQPTTGGRSDIGLIPQWDTHYLFVMGDTANYNLAARQTVWQKQVIGNADGMLGMAIMYRESGNGTERDAAGDGQRYYFNYETDQTTPAFGRVYSVQSRPVGQLIGGNSPDSIAAICSSGPCATAGSAQNKGWTVSVDHMPAAFYVPYMLTGRYSYLQGALGLGAWGIGVLEPNLWYGNRNKENGIAAVYGNFRVTAWILRGMHYAAIVAPDAAPEKAYFRNLLRHNSEFFAGAVDDGTSHSCSITQTSTSSITYTGSSVSIDGCGVGLSKPNGYVRNFPVCQIITSVSSVTVNGVSKTFGVAGVDTGKDWYYTPGSQAIVQADGAPALTSSDTLVISYGYGARPASDWCHGRQMYGRGMPNPLAIPMVAVAAGTAGYMGHSATTVATVTSFMLYYNLMVMREIETMGAVLAADSTPLFRAANHRIATLVLEPAVKPGANPYFMDCYTLPALMRTGTTPQDWSEYLGGFYTQIPLVSDVTNSTTTFTINSRLNKGDTTDPNPLILFPALLRIDSEWIQFCSGADGVTSTLTVCAGGRGMFGTTAASHTTASPLVFDRQLWAYTGVDHNYSNLYAGTVALFEDLGVASGTGRRAWERVYGTLNGTDGRGVELSWALVPRDRIQNLHATPGSGTLALAWTAPSGTACKVAVGASAPATSDDAADSSATVKSRYQTFNATGLSAGTAYYRVTCGTARTSGTVTIQ